MNLGVYDLSRHLYHGEILEGSVLYCALTTSDVQYTQTDSPHRMPCNISHLKENTPHLHHHGVKLSCFEKAAASRYVGSTIGTHIYTCRG